MSDDWLRTLIAVNHPFTVEQLGQFDDLFLAMWRHTALGTTQIIDRTNANHSLTPAEREAVFAEDDCLFFEIRGDVVADCMVGRRALEVSLAASDFAWASRSNIEIHPGRLPSLVNALMTSCESAVAIVGPADRFAASAVAELVCEGMTLEQAVQKIKHAHGLAPEGEREMEQYFSQATADRLGHADTYFLVRRMPASAW